MSTRFYKVYTAFNETYNFVDVTNKAFGNVAASTFPQTYDVSFGDSVGSLIYLGREFKFRQAYFTLKTSVPSGWQGVWEYATSSSVFCFIF